MNVVYCLYSSSEKGGCKVNQNFIPIVKKLYQIQDEIGLKTTIGSAGVLCNNADELTMDFFKNKLAKNCANANSNSVIIMHFNEYRKADRKLYSEIGKEIEKYNAVIYFTTSNEKHGYYINDDKNNKYIFTLNEFHLLKEIDFTLPINDIKNMIENIEKITGETYE